MLTVYGVPTCSSCQKAMRWLEEHNAAFQWVDLRQDPPDEVTIRRWVASSGGTASLRNTSGQSYRALGEGRKGWTDEQWVAAFSQDTMLLKRPIITRGEELVQVGFRGEEGELIGRFLDGA